jgi:hypothetical protein
MKREILVSVAPFDAASCSGCQFLFEALRHADLTRLRRCLVFDAQHEPYSLSLERRPACVAAERSTKDVLR